MVPVFALAIIIPGVTGFEIILEFLGLWNCPDSSDMLSLTNTADSRKYLHSYSFYNGIQGMSRFSKTQMAGRQLCRCSTQLGIASQPVFMDWRLVSERPLWETDPAISKALTKLRHWLKSDWHLLSLCLEAHHSQWRQHPLLSPCICPLFKPFCQPCGTSCGFYFSSSSGFWSRILSNTTFFITLSIVTTFL